MDGWTDRLTNKQTDRCTDRRTDSQTGRCSEWWAAENKPEGILGDGDPKELAQIVEHAHGGCAGAALQEGSYHVEQHKGIEDLQPVPVSLTWA